MKKYLSLVALIFTGASAFAQAPVPLEQDANLLAQEIMQSSRNLTPMQRSEISREIRNIRGILYATGPVGGPGPFGPGPDDHRPAGYGYANDAYTCVARDNDNQAPYVYAIRQGINIQRIAGASFSNINDCTSSLTNTRQVMDLNLTCLARDNDGQQPFTFAILNNNTVTRLQRPISRTLQACESILQNLRFRGTTTTLCTSRDNDGQVPFVAANLDVRTGQTQVGTELFQSQAACESFLNQ